MPIDPNVDTNRLLEENQEGIDYLQNLQKEQEATTAAQEQFQTAEGEALAEQEDPREAEDWGFKALVKEGQSILSGGLQDTASSLTTFPERTVDALSGEISRERKEKGVYRPEWDPFVDHENPIETKTWWGKLLRGTVHFGSLAAAIIPAAKVTLARVGLGAAWAGTSSLVRAAGVGAVSDLISKESDGMNALGAVRDRYGFIDTPISTKETDHPIMMKLKNIVEGIGIGLAFDGTAMLLGKGSSKAKKLVLSRNESAEKQTIEAGLSQLGKVIVQFIQAYYTSEKTVRLLNPNSMPTEIQINQDIYDPVTGAFLERINDVTVGRYDIIIVSGSTLPSNRWARFEYYKELYQMQIIDQIELLKQTDVADMEGVLERNDQRVQMAQQIQQLQQQVKQLSGDLQTAQRESVHDRKRVEIKEFEKKLAKAEAKIEMASQLHSKRSADELDKLKEAVSEVEKETADKPQRKVVPLAV